MLTAVTAYDLHAQTPRHDLTLVAVLEAHVLSSRAAVMFQLPSLMSALAVDLHDGAARPGLRIRDSKRITCW
jgi:hypothetical protein